MGFNEKNSYKYDNNFYGYLSEMLSDAIKKTIQKICSDQVVLKYLKSSNVPGGILYECSKIEVFGTEYKKGQYIILPKSTNASLFFGKIEK